MMKSCPLLFAWALAAPVLLATPIEADLHHLRGSGEPYRWSDFPPVASGDRLEFSFESRANAQEWTLWVRQYASRGRPGVFVNGRQVGRLSNDLRDMTLAMPLPPGTLVDGANTLRIAAAGAPPNDLLVGEIRLVERTVAQVLNETSIVVAVTDAGTGEAIPCRLTVVDEQGSLISVGGESDDTIAVRRGTIYSLNGQARFGLPAGRYTIYAGRGSEYSLDHATIETLPGGHADIKLAIRREVDTTGYVSIDTHVHIWEVSATPTERMITLAGEGILLPMMTEHNLHLDWRDEAARIGADRYFKPVIGNEVTTGKSLGHFNIYPIEPGAPEPDHDLGTWPELFDAMWAVPGVRVVGLNHGRDAHGRAGTMTSPLGPAAFNAASGRRLDGRPVRFNAMEVINSGATRTDPLQYVRDWLAMLNRGYRIVPVGGSDSHDVTRKFVGQGRTYVPSSTQDPRAIDIDEVMDNFAGGRVLGAGMGLLTRISVNGLGPGELVPAQGPVQVSVQVQGPHWAPADQVLLFANGVLVRRAAIDPLLASDGQKWSGTWEIDPAGQDLHLAAAALGPGITSAWWKITRPYQPDSIHWKPYVMGVSGAVYVDADRDGVWTSPHEQARRLFDAHRGNLPGLLGALADRDQATAIQAACLLEESGTPPDDPELQKALERAAQSVRAGFHVFRAAWQDSQAASL